MKRIRVIFIVILLLGVSSCKVSETTGSSLSVSQSSCLKYNQNHLAEVFEAYQIARRNNNINQTIDSITTAISYGRDWDTIYIIESCNPPLFSYHAIIWNKDNVFTLSGTGSLVKKVRDRDNLKFMRMIEKWDKEEIVSKSHEQPLKYYGEWIQSRIASRIVMRWAKCATVESVFFYDIDWESNDVPILFE